MKQTIVKRKIFAATNVLSIGEKELILPLHNCLLTEGYLLYLAVLVVGLLGR